MGNKACRLVLKVDEPHGSHQAGAFVGGRIFLYVTEAADLENFDRINLLLQGEERVLMPLISDDSSSSSSSSSESSRSSSSSVSSNNNSSSDLMEQRRPMKHEQSITSLIDVESCIVNFQEQLEPGEYEYPFSLKIPSELPSSMHCRDSENGNSSAEIRYTLSAYVEMKDGGFTGAFPGREGDLRDSALLHVTATPSHVHKHPISIQSQVFPVNSCCSWKNETIELGWKANADVCSPGGTVLVDVAGENNSRAKVKFVAVKLVETVSFQSIYDKRRRKVVRRTVVKQRIEVGSYPWWRHSVQSPSAICPHEIDLVIPPVVRDSYFGKLIHVRHHIVVSAETGGSCSTRRKTRPESASEISVVRTAAVSHEAPLYAANPHHRKYEKSTPVKDDLPSGWNPTVADSIMIVLEPNAFSPPQQEESPRPCAEKNMPLETTLTVMSTPESTSTKHSAFPDSCDLDNHQAQPTLEDLQCLVQNQLDTLEETLRDDEKKWATLVKNLCPRDYCATVQCASRGKASVARILAQHMEGNLTTRHVMACIYSLTEPSVRLQVLCAIAPLATDLDEHKKMVKEELSAEELACLRVALAS